ncbi:MAG: triose-phosphate isomerase [Candidatus Diapherotrites archaeon]|nr:triose-phosphate isomerase [Candidatus Diapherotrites archaeon]
MPKLPALFINFKLYESGTGKKALETAKIIEKSVYGKDIGVILVVQACDIRLIAQNVSLPIFAQHIDPVTYGAYTGHILPEAIKEAGAIGTILNHAENKRDDNFLGLAIKRAKECGLEVMVCAESVERAKKIASFLIKPDLIAIEPPELISGDISVSTAKPELISKVVSLVGKKNAIPIITGAGIKNSLDVRKSIELGCSGVFVASGIMKAKDKEKEIGELLSGFE